MKISTPAFFRLSASGKVFVGSMFASPSVTRMAIFCEFGRDVKLNSPVLATRNPAAMFVSPPSYVSALTAGSKVLMLVYWSNLISTLAKVLNLTTPIRTYVSEMAN